MYFKVSHIYDSRTVAALKELGIRHFGFCFHPKNIRFLQHIEFLKILSEHLDSNTYFYLDIRGESSSLVDHLLAQVKEVSAQKGISFQNGNIILETNHFYDFNIFHLLHFSLLDPVEVGPLDQRIQQLSGFVFNYQELNDSHQKELIYNMKNDFSTHFSSAINEKTQLSCQVKFRDDIYASILKIFNINMISVGIDEDVEVCFRNVDLQKLTKELKILMSKIE